MRLRIVITESLVRDDIRRMRAERRLEAVRAELRAQRERGATPSIKRAVAKVDGKPFVAGRFD